MTLTLTGCAALGGGPSPERQLEKRSFAVANPRAVCVPVSAISQDRVLDDHTIDFVLKDSRRLRATLTEGCVGLNMAQKYIYDSAVTGRLCQGTNVSFADSAYGSSDGIGGFGTKICSVSGLAEVRAQLVDGA